MISIEQLKETLCNTNFKPLNLPGALSSYCQVGYQGLRADKERYEEELMQQEAIKTAVEAGIEVNVIKSDNITDFDNLVKKDDKTTYRIAEVKYSSYLNYTENSTFDLPEDLIALLGKQMNDTVKLYGLKNPNSFIKSIILLNDPNYMVFNKYQMNQAVFKWRTDLAYYFKNNQQVFAKFPKSDLANLETAVLRENFHNSAIAQLAASHTGKNLLVLDYINKQYELYLSDLNEHYLKDGNDINGLVINCLNSNIEFYLIVKYQDCYLPCLKINNNNYFNILETYKELELTNHKYYFTSSKKDDEADKSEVSRSVNTEVLKKVVISEKQKMLASVIDINKLKRDDMQRIAIAYDIDIMKSGSSGNKIKKTKQDLLNDFKMIVYDVSKMSVSDF